MHQRCGKNILRFEVFGFPDFLVVKGFQEKIGLTNFGLKNCLFLWGSNSQRLRANVSV